MCKIKDIALENFRGIRTLRIESLGRVNVLLGNNNSGKSSLLEAMLILMGANKPSLPLEMNINRNYNGISEDDFAMFFHGLDTNTQIRMHAAFSDSTSRTLNISYFRSEVGEIDASEMQKAETPLLQQWNYGLEFVYNDDGLEKRSTVVYDAVKKTIRSDSSEKSPSRRVTFFMGPRYNFNDYISHFNQIVTDKEKDAVVEALQEIESRIKDVAVVGDKVMVDVGLDKLIPINLMGDGTRKLFTVATALYNAKGGVLIIDEVDNGLYYKSMKSLWRLILTSAVRFDVQVVLSTHSLDSLNALNSLLENEMAVSRDGVRIYTLRKDGDDDVTCYPYAYDKFNYLLGMEEEIR